MLPQAFLPQGLLLLLSLLRLASAHSFIVCTNLREDLPGQECNEETSFPYHESIP
jgi:hypothetical protein